MSQWKPYDFGENGEFYREWAELMRRDALRWNKKSIWTSRATIAWSIAWGIGSLYSALTHARQGSLWWVVFFTAIATFHFVLLIVSFVQHNDALERRRQMLSEAPR